MRLKKKWEHQLPNIMLDEFCQDIGNYLRRGHTLSECFAAMAARSTSASEEQLYLTLRTGVREGLLSDTMKHTGVFPDYMVYLISYAEQTNTLEQTVDALTTYFQRERAANESLHRHIAYPAVMAALTCGILIVTAGFVLPVFADQFAALGISFSPFARWAMRAGQWLCGFAGILLTAAVFAGVFLCLMLQNKGFPTFQHSLFARKLAASRFVAALALFCRCGMSELQCLKQAAILTPHPDITEAQVQMETQIMSGLSLPLALAQSNLISGNLLGILRTEGRPAFLLDETAARLAADSAGRMNRLLILLEPVIVLVLSSSAGLLLLSVMLPLLGGLASMG